MSFRIALFGSHYYGFEMLKSLLSYRNRFSEIEIVGVATDDPTKSWTSPQKRLWQYPHIKEDEDMVADFAKKNDIPVYRGRVKTDEFYKTFSKEWCPDLCYMGVFGQKIPERIWSSPLHGFYNFHSCAGTEWPSRDGGPQAFESMAMHGESKGSVAMHVVDNEFDHGPLVAFSEFFPFFKNEGVMKTFKRTSPYVAGLMAWHLEETLGISSERIVRPRVIAGNQVTTHQESIVPVGSPVVPVAACACL